MHKSHTGDCALLAFIQHHRSWNRISAITEGQKQEVIMHKLVLSFFSSYQYRRGRKDKREKETSITLCSFLFHLNKSPNAWVFLSYLQWVYGPGMNRKRRDREGKEKGKLKWGQRETENGNGAMGIIFFLVRLDMRSFLPCPHIQSRRVNNRVKNPKRLSPASLMLQMNAREE